MIGPLTQQLEPICGGEVEFVCFAVLIPMRDEPIEGDVSQLQELSSLKVLIYKHRKQRHQIQVFFPSHVHVLQLQQDLYESPSVLCSISDEFSLLHLQTSRLAVTEVPHDFTVQSVNISDIHTIYSCFHV